LKIKTKIVSCHTADFKPVKQEVNGTVILPPLVFPGQSYTFRSGQPPVRQEDGAALSLAIFALKEKNARIDEMTIHFDQKTLT